MGEGRSWMPALAGVVVLVALGAGAYGISTLVRAFRSAWAPPGVAPPGGGPGASTRAPGLAGREAPGTAAAPDPEAARRAMRRRFRPGPHVRVVGLLPAGLDALAGTPNAGPSALTRGTSPTPAGRDHRALDNPWIVAGARLAASEPPTGGTGRLRLGLAEGSAARTLVVGAPVRVTLRTEGPDVAGVAARFEGWEGTFVVPHAVASELGRLRVVGEGEGQLELALPAADARFDPVKETEVVLLLAALDADGHRSDWVQHRLRVLPVGAGDVEVTLTMERSTDLDLYVVGPARGVIHYARPAAGGGRLDLDANAACRDNLGVDAEHVVWDPGAAPPGTYEVRVAHYERCGVEGDVPYRVTVRACGEVAVLSGRFAGGGDPRPCTAPPAPSDAGWCQEVVRFDVPACAATPPSR